MAVPTDRDLQAFMQGMEAELRAYFKALYPGQYFDVNARYGTASGMMELEVISGGPEKVRMLVRRTFNADWTVAKHDYFALSDNLQGKGISPYIQNKFLGFYDKIGVKKIKVEANMGVGGYTWARYGFRPPSLDHALRLMAVIKPPGLEGKALADEVLRMWTGTDYKSRLLGSSWNGVMDLNDKVQREGYEAYIKKQGARSDLYKSVYGDPTPVVPKPPRAAPPPKPRFSAKTQTLGKARMEALLQVSERRIQRSFNTVIARLKGDLDINELADLITAGRMEEAIERLSEAGKALGAASNKEYVTAAKAAKDFLRGAGVGRVQFDQVNTRAVAAMQRNTLRLVSNFSAEQAAATRAAIAQGITEGLNPRDVARRFRDSIGLTQRQQAAVDNYRRLLGGTAAQQREALSRELHDGRLGPRLQEGVRRDLPPLTPEQIDRMTQRYAERYVKYRSEVIARTEGLRSVHEGVEELFEQAFDEGVVGRDELVRTWDSSRDGRVRDSHRHLHAMQRPFGQPFPGKAGPIKYPGDPDAPASETVQCRCLLTTRLKPTKG